MKHPIGVISDTHGLIRPEALDALKECELIIHAGDVGRPEVLDALRALARVIAVRGNVDQGVWARTLPQTQAIEVGGTWIYVLHDLAGLDLNPETAGFGVVISGHSHRPNIEKRNGVLYLNPGSAGPKRFDLPITVARLHLDEHTVEAELIHLSA